MTVLNGMPEDIRAKAQGVKILAFMVLFAFLFVKVSYTLRPLMQIRTFSMQPSDTLDVINIGASSCYAYWMPMQAWRQYGFTSYNFSSSAMPAQLIKYAIVESLKNQSPKLLIVDLRTFDFAEDNIDIDTDVLYMYREGYIRAVTDAVSYSLNRLCMIENGVPKEAHRLSYHFDISKYHANVENLLSAEQWKYALNIPDNTKYYGGYVQYYVKYFEWLRGLRHENYSSVKEESPLSETVDTIYLDLIDYCKSLDMDVLFILSPYFEREDSRKKYNYMRRIALENGISFMNCNDYYNDIGLIAQTDFHEYNHVQILGAKKYTKWLGQYLTEAYDLPDRRGDDKYADWDVAYELWVPYAAELEQTVLNGMPEDIRAKALEGKS